MFACGGAGYNRPMSNALKVIVVSVLGYAAYEAIDGYFRHRRSSGGPAGAPIPTPKMRPIPEPMGSVGGAAMTGGGEGTTRRTLDQDGESTATRVGRGVVRKNK